MTFLELQRMILQTRKARRKHYGNDYFGDNSEDEKFANAVYRKALHAANKVVKEYYG